MADITTPAPDGRKRDVCFTEKLLSRQFVTVTGTGKVITYFCYPLSVFILLSHLSEGQAGTFTQSDALTEISENRANMAALISVVLQMAIVLQTDGQADERAFFFFTSCGTP